MIERRCVRINIDFYRNYIEIVELGTLSAAAKSLHVAQSALSNQLKQFEEEYGAELFIRASRHMELTDPGRILYKKSKDIIALVDAAHKEISARVDGSQGCLRIGMTQAHPDTFANNMLLEFRRRNPRMRFEIYEESSLEVIEQLRAGVIEIGIERNPDKLPAFLVENASQEEQLCVYIRRDNPWIDVTAETVPVKDLARMPLSISRGIVHLLGDIFERENITPEIISVSTSRSNPMMWASAGESAAIIRTGSTEELSNSECCCLPLSSEDPVIAEELKATRSIVSVKDAVHSTAAQRFLDFVKEYKG